ncbi:Natural cytotoxicity triggering receptor 3 ligand 1 [Varanus komodoensis]|nr:Natural cytotoxicity triggering receptor 3 ligand 1 [Varanus komodoensis]
MKQGGKLGGCCRLLLSLALWLSHPAETLEVKMKSHKTEFLHADVVLPCRISGYLTPELNLNETEVMWYLVPYGGNQKMKVYSVVAGEHSSFRNGSRLDGNMLRKGNAELFLPQIQFSERGTYTCSVAVTGVRAEDITTLEIVVQPTVSLFPKEVTVERGKEKILSCKVNKFYPEVIDIKWEKNSKHTSDKMISPEDIHRVAPVENRDGTFNATSNLRLQPTLQDDGSVYICIVKHSSFPRHSSLNVTLKVTEPEKNLTWLIGVGIAIIIIVIPCYVYKEYFKTPGKAVDVLNSCLAETVDWMGPHKLELNPEKTEILLGGFPKIAGIFLEPSDAEYGSMMSLMCTVTDFYPEDISVKWYNGEECVTDHVLTEGPSKDSNGCFRLSSVFKLTPTALDYDKPKFFRVFHETLRNSIEKIVYLKLPAKSPVVSDIRPSQEEGSTSIRFEISLSDFAPPDIKVEWFKGWKRISDDNNPKDIQIGENQLCCFTSSIELKIEKELKAEDFKTIRCEVSHPATQTLQEKCFLLKVKAEHRITAHTGAMRLFRKEWWHQLPGSALRSGDLHCVAKLGVVHRILPVLFRHNRHEPLPPEDLIGQDDYNFQVLVVVEMGGGHVVQGALLVYDVADDERGDEEDAVAPNRVLHLDVDLVEGHHFPLQAGGLLHHLHADGGANDHALAQVAHAQHEAELAPAQGDHRVLAENERLGAPARLGRLHEDASQHDGVDHQPHDILHYQDEDGGRALLGHHAAAEADGHLHLDGEEEGRGEGVQLGHAGHEARRRAVVARQVQPPRAVVQVAVREGDEPPDHGEEQPAAEEGHGEDEQRVAPLQVHQGGEDVLQEAALLPDVLVRHIAGAVLAHEARSPLPRAEAGLLGHVLG